MKIVTLPKENFTEFIEHLRAFGEIHAPTKKGEKSVVFAPVSDLSEIELNYTRTILPLKKYFLTHRQPVQETILRGHRILPARWSAIMV